MTFLLLHLSSGYAHSAQTTLAWDPPVNTDGTPFTSFSGYKLFVGNASRSYTQTIDVGNTTTYALNNLSDGSTYFFAVADYDSSGNQSGYSNEVSKTFPFIYSLIATAGAGGIISPVGSATASTATNGTSTITSVTVTQGATQSFTITPATCYTIADVKVDGISVGVVAGYTFASVTANHTIAASFAVITYSVSATAGAGGSITPFGIATVNSGSSQSYTIAPATGYSISDVKVDGVSVGAVAGYTFASVTANHTIAASFAVITYSVNASAGTGGSITPSGTTTVNSGSSQSYTITPATGFSITDVKVDGVSIGAVAGYTFTSITANHTIAASFTSIPVRSNVALQSNGGVATSSSIYSSNYPVTAVNNGDRKGLKWGAGGGWNDATNTAYPDWVQITFNGQKNIDEIDVFTLQDAYAAPIDPTSTLAFTKYGITAFDVQYWNGTTWSPATGGRITGNNLVWRKIMFSAVLTDRIRVQVNASLAGYSRIVEIEAYSTGSAPVTIPPTIALTSPINGDTFDEPGTVSLAATAADGDGTVSKVEFYNGANLISTATTAPYFCSWSGVVAGTYTITAVAYDNSGSATSSTAATVTVNASTTRINVALQANGGVATSSSSYSSNYTVTAINNGDRKGLKWGAGGGWNDATYNAYPDWAQINFSGQKTVTEIDVFTVQDVYATPLEPTSSLSFTKYGITAFDVQYWNGTDWVTVSGGSITGNNLVWRKITFPAITTDRIRVVVYASLAGYSRITEIEAY